MDLEVVAGIGMVQCPQGIHQSGSPGPPELCGEGSKGLLRQRLDGLLPACPCS